MKYLLTILLGIVITISYRTGQKPDAPVKIRYDETTYTHQTTVSGNFLIISLYKKGIAEPVRVYIYSLEDIYGIEVSEDER